MLNEEVDMDSIIERIILFDPDVTEINYLDDKLSVKVYKLFINKYGFSRKGINIDFTKNNKLYLEPYFDNEPTNKQIILIKKILKEIPEIEYIYNNENDIEYPKNKFNDYFESLM